MMADEITDTFEALVARVTPTFDCESRTHPRRMYGCEDGGRATWAIQLLHPISPVPGESWHPATAEPRLEYVCTGRMIWLRGRLDNTVHCEHCNITATLRDWVRLLGPIGTPGR